MKVTSVSYIGKDGMQYVTVWAKDPVKNEHGLYNGGHMYSFNLNHKKQETSVYEYRYMNGVPCGFDECLKKWKGEILTEAEMLRYVEGLEKE